MQWQCIGKGIVSVWITADRFWYIYSIWPSMAWGLIWKLYCNGICGSLLISFIDSRKQWILLNDQCSSWDFINAGVPQGSILGPLLFYLYKRSNWKSLIKPKTFCKLHFFVYNNKWSKCKRLWGFRQNNGMGPPMKNEFQSWPI